MTGNTDLTAHLHPWPDFGAARQPDLSGQQHALAQLAAVGDHHQIVDLGSPTDTRRPQGGPVNRGVGADFDLVLKHDMTGLRIRHNRPVGQRHIAEPVAANDRAALQDNPVADPRALAHHRAGMGGKPVANPDLGINDDMGGEARPAANHHLVSDHGVGSDRGALANSSRGRNHGRGMNSHRRDVGRIKPAQHLRQGQRRVVHPDQGQPVRKLSERHVPSHQDRSRPGQREFGRVFFVGQKGQLSRPGLFDGLDAVNLQRAVAVEFGA